MIFVHLRVIAIGLFMVLKLSNGGNESPHYYGFKIHPKATYKPQESPVSSASIAGIVVAVIKYF